LETLGSPKSRTPPVIWPTLASVKPTQKKSNPSLGTPYYMSPELFKYKPYSYKSDIWALGCVMYEIMNLKHAFTAQTLNGLAVKILKGSYLPLQMLNVNPKERPDIREIIDRPIVKKRIIMYMFNV
jgi:serine/threonine protein kinase